MAVWEEVQQLRKSGQFEAALQMAKERLGQDSNDFRVRTQAEWVYYHLIKAVVEHANESLQTQNSIHRGDLSHLHELLKEYYRLDPERPGMAASNVLLQLEKIGRHFDPFVPFLQWLDLDSLRPEDYASNEYQGKSYPSLATKLAREAAAWINRRSNATKEQVSFVLAFARTAHERATDEDKLWLEWDLVKLLRRVGEQHAAADLMIKVLKRKRTDFWPWHEAALVYRDEQPELALACFCQSLRMGAEPKFLGRVHIDFAELLADEGNVAQASKETVIAAEIYDREGWRHPKELAALLQSDWYDPTLTADEPAHFYARHADDALILCFDEVRELPATFLGMMEGHDGKKPRPLFGVQLDKKVSSLRGRRGNRLLDRCVAGDPLTLLIGIEGERREVLEVLPRPDGKEWECLEQRAGVISWVDTAGNRMKVYLSRDQELWVPLSAWSNAEGPLPGIGICVLGATNPVSGRFEVYRAELIPLPQHADIGCFRGDLRRHHRGFGFVNDVLVSPRLLEGIAEDSPEFEVVAVQSFDKSKARYSWAAVAINPCP